MANVLDVGFLDMEGNQQTLRELGGQNTTRWLVVNVASKCGVTRHYANLQEVSLLDDVTVVGFPCNQFGGQEPGSHQEICDFTNEKYGVTFPLMSKIEVNGNNQALFVVDGVPYSTETNSQGSFLSGNLGSSRFLDLDPIT